MDRNREVREMICILCPLGCKMEASESPDRPGELIVRGQQCRKGKEYAAEEFYSPLRTVTSTVAIRGAKLSRLPVKTSKPIPKELIVDAVHEIGRREATGPVKMGDVIIKDLLGCGVDVVATRSLD